jgi:hypothetical protein
MAFFCGVYGYEITREFTVCGMRFVPRYTSFQEAQKAARDLNHYNLTATIYADEFPQELLFRLEAVLSFVEHLDVLVTVPEMLTSSEPQTQLPSVLLTARRNNGGGAMIGSDTFFRQSRPQFVEKALLRLADATHCESTGYRTLFFKSTETFRQKRPFLEVSYFLLFSGLETYVRRTLNDFHTREVAVVLNRRLTALGFNTCNFSPIAPERSMDTYARLRNALFHDSNFEARRTHHGNVLTFRLEQYISQFRILVDLVVLKATDFDDGHINWNAWLDRQLFK